MSVSLLGIDLGVIGTLALVSPAGEIKVVRP
jgi:hypothetical protein